MYDIFIVTKLNDISLLHIVVHCHLFNAMHNNVQQRGVIQFGYGAHGVYCFPLGVNALCSNVQQIEQIEATYVCSSHNCSG
jgi:hypothetical protein